MSGVQTQLPNAVASAHSAPSQPDARSGPVLPDEPAALSGLGVNPGQLEALVLKCLLQRGSSSGREIAEQLRLPMRLLAELIEPLRAALLLTIRGTAGVGDYHYELTEAGFGKAQRESARCSYAGAAPVTLEQYNRSVQGQSLSHLKLRVEPLREALSELSLSPQMISQLGQAINGNRGLFLYGPPGNGKTSIAERLMKAFDNPIWIPYTISIDGELVRLFDPSLHRPVSTDHLRHLKHDRRWVLIERPTLVVGGELQLELLGLQINQTTGISEAPVHVKANGGAFVIDDFGRQQVSPAEILNRLIVPLEKHVDYLTLPSGRPVEVPVHELTILNTNLCPKDLVDEAFLRRIPYKIEIPNPTESQFREVFARQAQREGFTEWQNGTEHLLRSYYDALQRPFRFCHARDLLWQVKNLCDFNGTALELTPTHIDIAVKNYFAAL